MKSAVSCLMILALLGVSVYAYISNSSHGWFASNDNVSADGAQIVAYDDLTMTIDAITVYKYSSSGAITANSIDPDLYNSSPSTYAGYLDMNPYDAIFGRNSKTPMVMKITLGNARGNGFTLSLECEGTSLKNISSVISVSACMDTSLDKASSPAAINTTTATIIYTSCQAICTAANNSTTGAITQSSINASAKYYSDVFYDANGDRTDKLTITVPANGYAVNSNKQVCVYLYIDYVEAYVDSYIDTLTGSAITADFLVNNINSATTGVTTANFDKDWTSITVKRTD